MKLIAFCVYDNKALAFLPPFFVHNELVAMRSFADVANDKTHAFGLNPTDYTLFRVGDFNDELGELTPLVPHVNMGLAASFLKGGQKDV